MNVVLSKHAERNLHRLSVSQELKVVKKLLLLQTNPHSGKPLTGKLEGLYSLRAWPYRIIYEINKERHTITVYAIEHRQGVYK